MQNTQYPLPGGQPGAQGGRQMNAPDETNYNMPPDTGAPSGESWVYGNPNLSFSGQGTEAAPFEAETAGPGEAPLPGMNGGAQPGGISSAAAQSQRMKNPVGMAATHMPANNAEAYQASLRSLLDRNVGFFVVVTSLVGTQQSVTWQGILHTVGSDYIVLYQPDYERYISCDFYSIKFVQFHNVKGVPYCAAYGTWQGQSGF